MILKRYQRILIEEIIHEKLFWRLSFGSRCHGALVVAVVCIVFLWRFFLAGDIYRDFLQCAINSRLLFYCERLHEGRLPLRLNGLKGRQ